MAKKVIYMDDLNPELDADAGTQTFSLNGSSYEIDLSTKNATKLSSVLAPFIAAARNAGRKPASHTANRKSAGGSGYNSEQLKAVREWATNNGFKVSEKGRISGEVLLAFEQAQAIPSEPVFKAV